MTWANQSLRYTNVYFFSLTQDEENKFKNTIYSLRYTIYDIHFMEDHPSSYGQEGKETVEANEAEKGSLTVQTLRLV